MDDYSDDDFDDLNPNALQELENNAIQFTQAQAQTQSLTQANHGNDNHSNDNNKNNNKNNLVHHGSQFFGSQGLEDEDLDDSELLNGFFPAPTGVTKPQPHQPHQPLQAPPPPQLPTAAPPVGPPRDRDRPLPPPSTSRVVPTPSYQPQPRWNNHPQTAARPNAPSNYGHGQPGASQRMPAYRPVYPQNGQFARPGAPPSTARQGVYHASQTQRPPLPHSTAAGNDVVAVLQQRVHELQAELNSARGEVSIIRTNSTKAQEEHGAELARLKKLNAEQQAKNQRLVEQAIAAEKNATTELQFLQRDMKEATSRAKQKENTGMVAKQPTGLGSRAGSLTPRKTNKTWGVADGFDDMDVVLSPSKGRGKARDAGAVAIPPAERTPSKGKRKRPMIDSPVMSLDVHEGDTLMLDDDAVVALPPAVSRGVASSTLSFELLPLILDHASHHREPPTFEILTRYAYPTDPTTSFAAIILQRLPLLGNPENPYSLLIDFAGLIIDMWHRCLEENFYRPIWDLASLIAFILELQTASVAPFLLDNLIPAIEKSIYKVAEIRFRNLLLVPSDAAAANEELEQHINTTYLLNLLRLTAMGSVTSIVRTEQGTQTRQAEFWSMVPLDLSIILLTPNQRLDDILGMMDLLCTSVAPNTVGPLCSDRGPESVARIVVEKLTCNLVDRPRAATTPHQLHAVGLGALRTLRAFAQSQFGAMQIAVHENAIPRLVTMLGGLVDELYDVSEPLPPNTEDAASRGHRVEPDFVEDTGQDLAGIHKLIKQIVLLLHKLVTDPRTTDAANIQSKLSMAYGGSHRYILALSRIHFAEEDLVYEAGIDEETAELARELCEFVVTPDEGEGVRDAFSA